MEWSLSKVMRLEKGQVNISPSDLRSVLAVLDVTDMEEIDELLADARVSRGERYANDEFDREHLTPATVRLIQFEAEATSILHYANIAVPGPLQTREYAAALLASHELDGATATARLEARMRRSGRVIGRRPSPDYRVILDESVLYRAVGGHATMAAQIQRLMDVTETSTMRIRVFPLEGDNPIFLMGPFTILDLDNSGDSILYRESPAGDETLEIPSEIHRHREVFDKLWPAIMDELESRTVMETIMGRHRR